MFKKIEPESMYLERSSERRNPVVQKGWIPGQARNDGIKPFSCTGASKSSIM